jgi:hypothetical protein
MFTEELALSFLRTRGFAAARMRGFPAESERTAARSESIGS